MSKQTLELSYLGIFLLLMMGGYWILDAFLRSTVAFVIFVPYGFALVWVMGRLRTPYYNMMKKRFGR